MYRTDVNGRPLNPPLQIWFKEKKIAQKKILWNCLNVVKFSQISWVTIIQGGNWLDENFPIWEFSGWELSWVGNSRWQFSRWSFPGWEFSGWEFCGWEFPLMGIFPDGSYPGWEFSLVEVFRVGIVWWESSGWQFSGLIHLNRIKLINQVWFGLLISSTASHHVLCRKRIAATNKQRKYKRENDREKCFLSLVSTRRLKVIKGSKIVSRKDDGVNRLVCMLGDKLISHLITFKHQKGDCQYQKNFTLVIVDQKVPTYLLSSCDFFFYWNWKKLLLREDVYHVLYILV